MQDSAPRRTQADRRAATRHALLGAARDLFVQLGYAETGTPEIVKRAAVTRGALYHHFADKADLMRALVQQEASAVAKEITTNTTSAQSPLEAFMSGVQAYFSAMAVPGRVKILLQEGPAVLGLTEMAEIDRQTGGATLLEGLRQSSANGYVKGIPLEPLADLLSASFDRAALAIANGENRADYEIATQSLLKGLFSN